MVSSLFSYNKLYILHQQHIKQHIKHSCCFICNNKYYILLETFGCQMNILDSDFIKNKLKKYGFIFTQDKKKANIFLYNTCSVRQQSEEKILSRLGELKSLNKKIFVSIIGCMAENLNKFSLPLPCHIDLLIGPSRISEFPYLLLNKIIENYSNNKTTVNISNFIHRKKTINYISTYTYASDSIRTSSLNNSYYLRITHGCNQFCSFCIVPRTRGPEIHRNPYLIFTEIKKLLNKNQSIEIVLLGQSINNYTYKFKSKRLKFSDLLYNIHERFTNLKRLKFLTSHPRNFDTQIFNVISECYRISKYLHFPIQSGSNKILRMMNRGYNIDSYLKLINLAKSKIKNINLVSDIIVGYPTENKKDFLDTLNILKKILYNNIYIFKYSSRPNTISSRKYFDNISHKIKILRNNIALSLQRNIKINLNNKLNNNIESSFVDQKSKINSRKCSNLPILYFKKYKIRFISKNITDHIINFNGHQSLLGSFTSIKIIKSSALSLRGILLSNNIL